MKRARTAEPFSLRAAVASTKGRKLHLEDVPLLCPHLEGLEKVSFYAILDGHGGVKCAEWAAARLPALLVEWLRGAHTSPEVKEALRSAFVTCDTELLERCHADGWDDGACIIGLMVDGRCDPPRGYVANVGDSRAYAAVEPPSAATVPASTPSASSSSSACSASIAANVASAAEASGAANATAPSASAPSAVRAVSLSKDHTALDPKERRRIEAAGGYVQNGRVNGLLEVSRSFGDRRLKRGGSEVTKGTALVLAQPDVASFAIGHEQRFVLLACDGLWKVFSGVQAVTELHARLPVMDARRAELAARLDDPATAAALTKESREALLKERECVTEEGCLRSLLHEAVQVRHAKDNVTALLVRFPPTPWHGIARYI